MVLGIGKGLQGLGICQRGDKRAWRDLVQGDAYKRTMAGVAFLAFLGWAL